MKKIFTIITALILFGSLTVKAEDTNETYTAAGSPESVFGTEWSPETNANDMTLSNGLYVFAKKDNFASKTPISFKVCKDHGWGTAYPSSNYNFDIPAGSKYLIITYNTDGNAVNAFAISSMTVAGEPAALFGEGTTWAPTATANNMTLQNDGTYKFEKSGVALSAGTIVKFKACANHGWDNAWPGDDYSLSITESGEYTITITFDPATLSVSASAVLDYEVEVIPTIKLHGNFTGSWVDTEDFVDAGNEETATLTLTGVTKGNYEFGVKIDGSWTTNGSAFTRANNSHAIASGSGNCTFNADRNGDYTFTWTYATNTLEITYPAIPSQSVELTGLSSQILKGTVVNFSASSSGIDEPGYRYYVKTKGGSYGSAVTSYTFNTLGEYVVKVEALEYNSGDPVASDESEVLVYDEHTFASGTTIYIDFTAMTEGAKGVNFPKVNEVGVDYDGAGAGTFKSVTFTGDVTWTTMADAFIKTEKAGWAALKFSVPADGQNWIKVAADGASYTWDTYEDLTTNIFLAGGMNSWATNNEDYKFTVSDDIATLEVSLDAESTCEFKLYYNGAWLGANYDFKYYWCTDVVFSGSEESNAKIYTFKAGTYTFRYKISTGELSIVYPATSATDVTISQYEYATLYSATAFDVPAEVEAYIISGVDGIKLTMERIYRIPAETGVLLHAPQGTYPFYEGDGRWMDAPASNLLKGSTTNETIDNDQVHYVLSYDTENQVGFYWPYGTGAAQGVGAFENKAGKAYVEIPADEQPVGVIARRGFPFRPTPQVATDLEQVPSYQVPSTKVLIDGQLFIIRDGMLFNAQGARVQ